MSACREGRKATGRSDDDDMPCPIESPNKKKLVPLLSSFLLAFFSCFSPTFRLCIAWSRAILEKVSQSAHHTRPSLSLSCVRACKWTKSSSSPCSVVVIDGGSGGGGHSILKEEKEEKDLLVNDTSPPPLECVCVCDCLCDGTTNVRWKGEEEWSIGAWSCGGSDYVIDPL